MSYKKATRNKKRADFWLKIGIFLFPYRLLLQGFG